MFDVTIPGKSALWCPATNTPVSRRTETSLVENGYVWTCSNCGKMHSIESLGLRIQPGSVRYLDIENVRKAPWYHATYKVDWLSLVQNAKEKPLVHIGTRFAAGRMKKNLDSSPNRISYMHRLTLSPEATIAPEIWEDLNDWPESCEELDFDVIRYLNRWESPGSISLLARPKVLQYAILGPKSR